MLVVVITILAFILIPIGRYIFNKINDRDLPAYKRIQDIQEIGRQAIEWEMR